MNPGHTSLPRAWISWSTVPEKSEPTWTIRSPSHTTTPSRTSVCAPWAKPTTQPSRMSPRIVLRELGIAGGLGGSLAVEEHAEVFRPRRDEASEQEVLERCLHLGGLIRSEQGGGQPVPRLDGHARGGDERRAGRGDGGFHHAHPRQQLRPVPAQQTKGKAGHSLDVAAPRRQRTAAGQLSDAWAAHRAEQSRPRS